MNAVYEQLGNIFNPRAYLESFLWLLLTIGIAISFKIYCELRHGRMNVSTVLLKKVFPKTIAYMLPVAGQLLLVTEVLRCFTT
tara:strand:+ start:251 stop:499 length:249 start_codon:yes stop_codon:yes gene_type:complete